MHPTEALTTMSFANFLQQTDAVGLFVFGLLVVMSIVSWYFIVLKAARVIRIRTRSHHVVTTFWKTPTDQALGYLEQQPDWEPFSKIALDGEFSMEHHDRLTEERVAGTLHRAQFLDPGSSPALLDQPRDGAPGNGSHVPCDRRQHGAVHRPVRHGVGNLPRAGAHRRVRRDLARPSGRWDPWAKH